MYTKSHIVSLKVDLSPPLFLFPTVNWKSCACVDYIIGHVIDMVMSHFLDVGCHGKFFYHTSLESYKSQF